MCSAPHEAAPSFATLKLTHVFRLARAEQHSPTLAVTEPRLISGQPCNGRADVGRQPPTSNYELLDQAGIAASPPGHTQTRTGVVSLIDRRTSRDHFSGLMRSGHSGPLDKSLAFGRSRRRIGLPSPKICMRRLALNESPASVGKDQPTLQAQYARGLPHFR